jgi:hypothetical protein
MPSTSDTHSTRGLNAMAVFLAFATSMATVAGVTLAFPGTFLDKAWSLNPNAHHRMQPLGRALGIPFLLLGIALGFAAIGWMKRRYWAWVLTVIIIATQLAGDAMNLVLQEYLRGALGVAVAGALLFWLLRPTTRAAFHKASEQPIREVPPQSFL